MRFKSAYIAIFFFSIFQFGVAVQSLAQPSLGVVWNVPESNDLVETDLVFFKKYGIEFIEVDHPIDDLILRQLEDSSFTIFVRLEPAFLTLSDIQKTKNQLNKHYTSIAREYRTYSHIGGLGLLTNSQTTHQDFETTFSSVLDSLGVISNNPSYYYSTPSWYNFDSPEPFGVHFNETEFEINDLTFFNQLIQNKVSNSEKPVIFINSDWLKKAVSAYPEFAESLTTYKVTQDWKFPLPESETSNAFPNWLVLLLLIMWLVLAVQFKFLPYVRPMLIRYFLAHRFFVDDILHYRERAALGGVLLMIQHAVFAGIVSFITAKTLFSQTGMEAFFFHFPALALTGENFFSFFFSGMILVLITQFIAVLWLHLPAKNIGHISQTINLYAGPFFLDFLLVTVLITLDLSGYGTGSILTFAALFVIIWYAAFNFAAFDISSGTAQGRFVYLLLTIGLHAIVSIGLLLYVLMNSDCIQILELSLSL